MNHKHIAENGITYKRSSVNVYTHVRLVREKGGKYGVASWHTSEAAAESACNQGTEFYKQHNDRKVERVNNGVPSYE